MLVDLAVILAYFVAIGCIGLRVARRRESLSEFALGGRRIPWWAALASIVAAETSAATFFGVPAEGYKTRSLVYAQLALGAVLARVIVAYIFLKPYYKYEVYSVYELLEKRFGPASRFAGSLAFLVTRILASGVRLYIASVVLVVAYKFLTHATPGFAHYLIAIIIMAAVTTLYTSWGGIKAVVWTDLIQAGLMIGGGLFAVYMVLHRMPGGWDGVRLGTDNFKDFRLFDSGLSGAEGVGGMVQAILGKEYTLWTALIGYTILVMATHGIDQDMVQRMLTTRDVRQSRLSLILSGLVELPLFVIFSGVGILLFAFYQRVHDESLPAAPNEIFAYFIVTRMPEGARGLVLAAVFATAMGSFSAALNALATSFVRDFYGRYLRPGRSDPHYVSAARYSTALFAGLMIAVAGVTSWMVLRNPETTIIPIALKVFGYTYGPLLGIYLAGVLTSTRGRDGANVAAMIAGCLGVVVLSGLVNLPGVRVPPIAFTWYVLIGCAITFGTALCFPSRTVTRDEGSRA